MQSAGSGGKEGRKYQWDIIQEQLKEGELSFEEQKSNALIRLKHHQPRQGIDLVSAYYGTTASVKAELKNQRGSERRCLGAQR